MICVLVTAIHCTMADHSHAANDTTHSSTVGSSSRNLTLVSWLGCPAQPTASTSAVSIVSHVTRRGAPVCPRGSCSPFDVGVVFERCGQLTRAEKYECLKNVWVPDTHFDFPYTVESNRKRKFSLNWLGSYSWLAYSKWLDGVFCIPCAFFGREVAKKGCSLDKLYKSPLVLWTTAKTRFVSHSNGHSDTHEARVSGLFLLSEGLKPIFAPQ